jgi:chromosome segregation ATPase
MTARPLTQQGMSGMKTQNGGGRFVQDGHFFYAKLSEKRSQILEVNERLRKEIEDLRNSRPRSLQMMEHLEDLNDEVKGLESQFQNYNLVVQKATIHATPADLQLGIASLQVPCPSRSFHRC